MSRLPHSIRARQRSLSAIFAPKSVAVVGATEQAGKVGRTIMQNFLTGSFGGQVYAVNPTRDQIFGRTSHPSIAAIDAPVDLAVIATPAPTVPAIMRQCVEAGVRGVVVVTAGFREAGPTGAALEAEIAEIIQATELRLVGPNCLGIMRPSIGLNATFASSIARPGSVAFISQSGALGTAILDWSFREKVGFSAFVSVGSMLDISWGDLIDYLGDDPLTKSILIYMESIGDARAFLSAAREVAFTKPIIVLKAGRTEAAAQAAASHTGTLAGRDDVLNAAFRRAGVLRIDHMAELFYTAEVLAKQPRPKGPRLSIITNAGGPGVLAADSLIRSGGELAALNDETRAALDQLLPPHWSRSNPIDVLADAEAGTYGDAFAASLHNPNSDGFLAILAPMGMADPTQTAQRLVQAAKSSSKPILASWMGAAEMAEAGAIFRGANIPTFPFPETAARVFSYMWKYSYNLRGIYETPSLPLDETLSPPSRDRADAIITRAASEQRTLLTEHESKQLLAAYGIPVTPSVTVTDAEKAVESAREIGFPVVLKLNSATITHKTDVGGVKLNLQSEEAVRRAYHEIEQTVLEKAGREHFAGVTVQPMIEQFGYELIIGCSIDAQFGPVLLFGSGGQLVEVYEDHALALPPLNTTLARRLIEQTRIYKALRGVRGRDAVDLPALEMLLVRFSQLVAEQPRIKEIEINPLLAQPGKQRIGGHPSLLALDARVVLHPAAITDQELPALAIRPYPSQYASPWTMRNGETVLIRPIRPEDETYMIEFHKHLSDQSVYLRYFHYLNLDQRIDHARLARLCFVDYDREIALVVEHRPEGAARPEIIAVGRLVRLRNTDDAEFAIVINDRFQRQGLGTELLQRLVAIGKAEGMKRIVADMLQENRGMQRSCEKVGFTLKFDREEHVVKAVYHLTNQ